MQQQPGEKDAPAKKSSAQKSNPISKIAALLILLVLVGIGSFAAGVHYQKGRTTSSASSSTNRQFGPGGGSRFSRNGSFGSVTAISSSSITVQDRRSNSTKTYSITSTTTITNSGAAASYSDIAVGDDVIVTTASSTSTDATRIALNPTMGGAPGGQSDSTPSTTSN